jgi:large subunit ribosomal protein L15
LFKTDVAIVNISSLARLTEDLIDRSTLIKYGLVDKGDMIIKVLGSGELDRKITVTADFFSTAAEKKILDAGGSVVKLASGAKIED